MCVASARAKILAHFHRTLAYEHAVVAEHTVYMRKAASFLCASHLGTDLVHDPAFLGSDACSTKPCSRNISSCIARP